MKIKKEKDSFCGRVAVKAVFFGGERNAENVRSVLGGKRERKRGRKTTMIKRYIEVECDNCNEVMTFYNFQITDVYTAIRERKWAVSRDRLYCFCPKCREKVTCVGRNGVNKLLPFSAKKEKHRLQEEKFRLEEEERERAIYEGECVEFMAMNKD